MKKQISVHPECIDTGNKIISLKVKEVRNCAREETLKSPAKNKTNHNCTSHKCHPFSHCRLCRKIWFKILFFYNSSLLLYLLILLLITFPIYASTTTASSTSNLHLNSSFVSPPHQLLSLRPPSTPNPMPSTLCDNPSIFPLI